MTLGIHAQDFENEVGITKKHIVYFGFFFFRIVLEFKMN